MRVLEGDAAGQAEKDIDSGRCGGHSGRAPEAPFDTFPYTHGGAGLVKPKAD